MEKKITTPSLAERKQALESCIHKIADVHRCIFNLYPSLTNRVHTPISEVEEELALELSESIYSSFPCLSRLFLEVMMQEGYDE